MLLFSLCFYLFFVICLGASTFSFFFLLLFLLHFLLFLLFFLDVLDIGDNIFQTWEVQWSPKRLRFCVPVKTASQLSAHYSEKCVNKLVHPHFTLITSPTQSGAKISILLKGFEIIWIHLFCGLAPTHPFVLKSNKKNSTFLY